MFEVDRVVAVIKPTEVMLKWLNDHLDEEEKLNMESLQQDCTVLLIPPFEEPEEAEEYLLSLHNEIFEGELASWEVDAKHWPTERSIEAFQQWFTLELHSMVYDIGNLDDEMAAEDDEDEDDEASQTIQ